MKALAALVGLLVLTIVGTALALVMLALVEPNARVQYNQIQKRTLELDLAALCATRDSVKQQIAEVVAHHDDCVPHGNPDIQSLKLQAQILTNKIDQKADELGRIINDKKVVEHYRDRKLQALLSLLDFSTEQDKAAVQSTK